MRLVARLANLEGEFRPESRPKQVSWGNDTVAWALSCWLHLSVVSGDGTDYTPCHAPKVWATSPANRLREASMHDGTSLKPQTKGDVCSGAAASSAEIEAQLQRILESSVFRSSPRHSRFLSFVVRKALAGEADSIKEYPIGLEVFDRTPDFDPAADPVVRSEARRLRGRLADYYKEAGKLDPVHIELPKGTYVPVFSRNGVAPEIEGAARTFATTPESVSLEGDVSARHKRNRWFVALMLIASACALSVYAIHLWRHKKVEARAAALAAKPLLVADFTNTTGDSVFDYTLRQGLLAQLEQTPFLSLLSRQRIAQTLALMSQPPDARLTRQLARDICLRTGGAAVIEGSIERRGNQYLLALKAAGCADGEQLANVETVADSRSQVLKAMGKSATELRAKLGESLTSIQQYDVPLENVTTPSLEALQAYTLGVRAKEIWGDFSTAAPLFQRAIGFDPNFAMAYAQLGTVQQNDPRHDALAQNYRQAYDLRERVSQQEGFYIESHYYHLALGDLPAARRVYEQWIQTYPRDSTPRFNLGQIDGLLGDHDKALKAYQDAIRLNPGFALIYANLVLNYVECNRWDEAETAARQAQADGFDTPLLHLILYVLKFLQHDNAAMEREVEFLSGKPGFQNRVLLEEAATAAYYGKFGSAREITHATVDTSKQARDNDTAAEALALEAAREALVGSRAQALEQAHAGWELSRNVTVPVAFSFAMAGDAAQAVRLADQLAQEYPHSTTIQFNSLPLIRAAIALQQGDSRKAIELLAPALPYELGDVEYFPLYVIYLRGNAYLAEGHGVAAAAEFQKLIEHPGIVLNEPIGALAHLGLGRAYALAGDAAKAKIAYQDFLSLWRNADPDIPVLKQAKAEYAKIEVVAFQP